MKFDSQRPSSLNEHPSVAVTIVIILSPKILINHPIHPRYEKKSDCLKKSYNNNHRRQIMYRGQVVELGAFWSMGSIQLH